MSERGVHIGHEYVGISLTENHAWYVNPVTGKIEIYPAFDAELAYIESQRSNGLIWSPTVAEMVDYLVPLKDVSVQYNADQTYTVTNNSPQPLTGVTLLAEDAIQSVKIDNRTLVSFGRSYGSKELALPTLSSGQSFTLSITFGSRNDSIPVIVSTDTGKDKINELTGVWDDSLNELIVNSDGNNSLHAFSAKIPNLANKPLVVQDTESKIIGTLVSSGPDTWTFSMPLGSLRTFVIKEQKQK